MSRPKLQVRRVGPIQVPEPKYQTPGSSGLDLCAALAEPITLRAGERRLIPTGIAIAIPPGLEGQVRPRSGWALKAGIGIVNSPGTIDADFRGTLGVVLINLGQEPFVVQPLDRIAQLVITPVVQVDVDIVDELDETERGGGGYGSTGTR